MNAQEKQSYQKFKSLLNTKIDRIKRIESLNFSNEFLKSNSLRSRSVSEVIITDSIIKQYDRKKVRNWIVQLCHLLKFSTESTSLTLQLFDYYFKVVMKPLKKKQLQPLAIACLITALDINQNQNLLAQIYKFDRQQIKSFQRKIFDNLQMNIDLITYNRIANDIQENWKRFCSSLRQISTQNCLVQENDHEELLQKILSTNFAIKLLNELLIFALNFKQGLQIQLDDLVFNAFYFILAIQVYQINGQVTQSDLKNISLQNLKLWIFFELFGKFCHQKGYDLNIDLYETILSYLAKIYNSLISDFDPTPFKEDYGVESYDVSHKMWREALRIGENNCQTCFFVNSCHSYEKVVKILSDLDLNGGIQFQQMEKLGYTSKLSLRTSSDRLDTNQKIHNQ